MTAPTSSPVPSTATPAASAGSGTPVAASARSEKFRQELAEMKIREPKAGRDSTFVTGGLLLMAAGFVVAIVAYFMSHGTDNPLQQRDAFTIGLIGVTVTIAGAAIFLRYSLAGFMRFWLARFLFEQQQRSEVVSLGGDADRRA